MNNRYGKCSTYAYCRIEFKENDGKGLERLKGYNLFIECRFLVSIKVPPPVLPSLLIILKMHRKQTNKVGLGENRHLKKGLLTYPIRIISAIFSLQG